ncbi:DUF4303 domain-containing protein [Ruminococcus sp.]|uniref:DUF4303 domain-containing protein n=1 Tax=Ruminococcus sp. TaxID=41978 RepID=UPI0025CBEE5A|nr:DUF4303 domain-containing protein [Ruminococcus sp.]
MNNSGFELEKMLTNSAGKCIKQLFHDHKEQFYYCAFIKLENSTPFISAWSFEALEHVIHDNQVNDAEKKMYKWSYADSPYCAYQYDDYFLDIQKIYEERISQIHSESDYIAEELFWLNSMEKAMSNLDKMGLFGVGEKRLQIVINVEVMPPDFSNTERALRLNPRLALTEWLEECSEEDEFEEDSEDSRLCNVVVISKITNKNDVLRIKKAFGYTGSVVSLFQGVLSPPFELEKEVKYKDAIQVLSKFPALRKFIHLNIVK